MCQVLARRRNTESEVGTFYEEGPNMNVKGFILENDQGQEFVMGCEQSHAKLGRMFLLRGWQRRRLVPLRYSEREGQHIVGEALIALDDLFSNLLQMGRDRMGHEQFLEKSSKFQKLLQEPAQRS